MKKLYTCIRYDIKEGIVRLLPLYLLEIFIVVFLVIDAVGKLKIGVEHPGVTDILIQIFQGREEYTFVRGGPPFELDNGYLAISVMAGLFSCYYAKREWKLRGNIFIIRYASKAVWWYSKCIWCILQMVVYFVVLFSVVWIMAAAGGNGGLEISQEAVNLYKGQLLTRDYTKVLLQIFLLGAATAIALNQMQISLQMTASPVAGFVALIGVVIISAYTYKMFLIGNNYMLLRTEVFKNNGITLGSGLIAAGVVWAIAVIAGYFVVRKKDIL